MDLAILFASLSGVAIAFATAFFTSRFYAHQARADLQKEFESRFNERKWETYTGFADTVRQVLESTKGGRMKQDMSRLGRKMLDFTSSLWIVGSDEVVEAFVEWQRHARALQDAETARKNPIEGLEKLTDIMIEMRRDLGYATTHVQSKDLLATFITDIDQYPSG